MDFRSIFKSKSDFNFNSSSLLEHLSFEEINELLNILKIKDFKKGEVLIQVGDIEDNFYLLKKGVVSATKTDCKGKIFTRSLYTENHLFASPMILRKEPSNLSFTCLTDINVIVGSYKSFLELTKMYPKMAQFYNLILQEAFILFDQKINEHGALNATQRYLLFIKKNPKIETLISQKQIAYALGISPVQLSRLKTKLKEL